MSTSSHSDSNPNPTPALSPPVTAAIIAGSVIIILTTAIAYLLIYHRNRRKQRKQRDAEAGAKFDANDIVESYGDRDDDGDIHFRTSTINTAMANPPVTPRASDVMRGHTANDAESDSARGRSRHRRSLFESTIFRLGHIYSKRAKKEQSMLGTDEMVSIWLDMLPSTNPESPPDNHVNGMMPLRTVAPQPILRNRAKSMPSMRPNRRSSTEYTEESYGGSSASKLSVSPPVDAGLGTGITDPRLIPRGSLRVHRSSTAVDNACKTAHKTSSSDSDSDAETIHFPHLLKRAASLRFRRNTTAALNKSRNPYSPAAKRQTFRKHNQGSQSLSFNVFTDYGTSMATQRGSDAREQEPETMRFKPLRSKSMPAGQVQTLPIESQPNMEALRARARTTGVSEQEMTQFLLHEYRRSVPLEKISLQQSPKTLKKENVQPELFPIPQEQVQKQRGMARRNTAVVDGRFTNHSTSDSPVSLKRARTTRSAGTRRV